MRTIDQCPQLREVVDVQDVDVLLTDDNVQSLPLWLTGTPMLVSTVSHSIFKGEDAIVELICVGLELGKRPSEPKTGTTAQVHSKTVSRSDDNAQDQELEERSANYDRGWPAASNQRFIPTTSADTKHTGTDLDFEPIVDESNMVANGTKISGKDVEEYMRTRDAAIPPQAIP